MEEEHRRNPSLLIVVRTIIWSFFGVRGRAAHDSETVHLSPVQILVAGVVGAAVLVLGLVALVRFIVANAV
jgi:hypothetical protein